MSTLIVSPHLDDAALSASVELAKGGATVVSVFTALPPADREVTWWDRLTGASDSRRRQLERLAEDAAAMRLVAAESVHLDELEAQYRDRPPDVDRISRRLAEHFATAEAVWLPAALGAHPDHVTTRDAALHAVRDAGCRQVVIYADFPYTVMYGWPSWATGRPGDPYVDADFWFTYQLTSAGLNPSWLESVAVRLDAGQRRLKADIIATYRTQTPALGLGPLALAADPSKLDHELYWQLAHARK